MNPDDMKILSDMARTIREAGSIKADELWKSTNLSIWQFNKYKKFLPITFDDIELDRKKKNYVSRNNISLLSKEVFK